MLASEILMTEGRDAPLFHGSPLPRLLLILHYDKLGRGERVSLSRSYAVSNYFRDHYEKPYGGILVLDQNKLRHKFRMSPHHDSWASENPDHQGFQDEQEEVLTGVIYPLSRYLISINADPAMLKAAVKDRDYLHGSDFRDDFPGTLKEFRSLVAGLLKHPLLNHWKPRSS